jgi:hypothetical protein
MKALDKLISGVNKYISRAQLEKRQTRALLLRKAALFVKRILSVFGELRRRPPARPPLAVSLRHDGRHVNCKLGWLMPITVETAVVWRKYWTEPATSDFCNRTLHLCSMEFAG